jgi:hypothetical protein
MIPVETVTGIRGRVWKTSVEKVNSSIIYLILCKNLCKCYNVLLSNTTVIIKKVKESKPEEQKSVSSQQPINIWMNNKMRCMHTMEYDSMWR